MPKPHQALIYDYVENAVEARAPHRQEHLALVQRYLDAGDLTAGGALGDPPHGAAIVFRVDDPQVVQEFVESDPYIEADLVTRWRIEPWKVV